MTRIPALGGLGLSHAAREAGGPMVTRQCPLSLHSSAAWTCWKTVRCLLGRASDWPGGESAVLKLVETDLEWRLKALVHGYRVESAEREGLPQEFDESSDSQRTDGFDESAGVVRDDV